jgi:hypothetical protein
MTGRVPYPAVCIGGIAIGLLISLSFGSGPHAAARRAASSPPQSRSVRAQPAPDPLPARIRELIRSARLMEAQDACLEILVSTPNDDATMRGLVAIRRRLALDDPVLLRRQAEAYGEAAAYGVELTGEHYTRAAMTILAEASLRAAQEIERQQGQRLIDTPPR